MIETQHYLNGENIVKSDLYRICYLLAKWYKEQGLSQLEIRESIFKWANNLNLYLKFNLNDMIHKALSDDSRLKDNVVIRINESDIYEISRRFDNPKTKFVALAVLCYAKSYANRDKCFFISSVSLGAWLTIHGSNLKRKYIKELIDFEYLSIVDTPKNTYKWNSDEQSKNTKYKILVPIHNSGIFILEDNDIEKLYHSIFTDCI